MKIEPASKALATLRDRRSDNSGVRFDALRVLLDELRTECAALKIGARDASTSHRTVLELTEFGCTLTLERPCNIRLSQSSKGGQVQFPVQELLEFDVLKCRFEGRPISDVAPMPGERPRMCPAVDVLATWLLHELSASSQRL